MAALIIDLPSELCVEFDYHTISMAHPLQESFHASAFFVLRTVEGARTTTVTRIATRERWEPNHLLWTLPRAAAAGYSTLETPRRLAALTWQL